MVPKGLIYIISLGAPHGWDWNREEFFESKYIRTKTIMSAWHDVERMSQHGSAMVANNMVYSRFRYLISFMCMPRSVSQAIQEDVQQLVWGRDVYFDPDEFGSDPVRRYIKEGAQYRARRHLGIGLGLYRIDQDII